MNDDQVKDVVNEYLERTLPLDVYILDMDWHTKQGWGGYSFDQRLFPVPSATLGWLKRRDLHVGANLHDDDGVRPTENMHDQMCTALGMNPATCGTVPFSMVNQSIVYALEDVVLKDVENQGMDFWWIDWCDCFFILFPVFHSFVSHSSKMQTQATGWHTRRL